MSIRKTITDKLEAGLTELRLRMRITPDEYKLWRLSDAELIAILSSLDARLSRLEKGAGQ